MNPRFNKTKIKRDINFSSISGYVVVFSISFLLTIGLVLLKNNFPAVKKFSVMATTIQPEAFTELYFENHLNLSNFIIPDKTYSFTFTIHNLEYRDMDYPYVVYLTAAEKKTILDEGTVRLKQGEYRSIPENFGPLIPARMKVTVELTNINQQISFWMYQP